MKSSIMLVFIIILVLTVYACAQYSQKLDTKKSNDIQKGENGIPPLKVFGKTSVIAKALNKSIKENNIAVKVTIEEIINYSKVESQDTLLRNGDVIIIEFSGIGDKNEWKAVNITTGNMIKVELRCLDGRNNSLKPFTKNDCYWEGTDETVSIT